MSADLDLALRLADEADAISLPRYRTELTIETKPDLTPVTEADRAVEAEIRRMLASERPRGLLVLDHLQGHPTPKPPTGAEIRDGQVYRWRR